MRIPDDYHAVWTGLVHDDQRSEPYACTLELHGSGGSTRYEQPCGLAIGRLELTDTAPVLREHYTGPRGGPAICRLMVRLNGSNELVCHWQRDDGAESRATLWRLSVV